MKESVFLNARLKTPCFVYEQSQIEAVLTTLIQLQQKTGCIPLYSIKAANLSGLLALIQPYVSGFSCSSLNEARLAREILNAGQSIHVTTPGYREQEWNALLNYADFISLNSLTQCERYAERIQQSSSCGLRINPQLSFVKDRRYDPCRANSKLGVTLDQLCDWVADNQPVWQLIDGIHIHNNCESRNFTELLQTVETVLSGLSGLDKPFKWFNLGGGYLFEESASLKELEHAIRLIKESSDADVYIEPGKALVGHVGYLVACVIDLFEAEGKQIAMLDTTVNHLPEVFEYQYQPEIVNSVMESEYAYRLTGSSCLSGDMFGDYCFPEELKIGSRVIFSNIGAYMQVKSNMFNGINLPTSYLLKPDDTFKLLKEHDYDSFRSRL